MINGHCVKEYTISAPKTSTGPCLRTVKVTDKDCNDVPIPPVLAQSTTQVQSGLINRLPTDFVAVDPNNLIQDKPQSRDFNNPLPLHVPCRIQIILNGEPWEQSTVFDLGWQVDSQYKECIALAEGRLRAVLADPDGPIYGFYKVSHQYRILHSFENNSPISAATSPFSLVATSNSRDKDAAVEHQVSENSAVPPIYAEDIPNDHAWAERLPPRLAEELLRRRLSILHLELKLSYTVFHHHSEANCEENCFSAIQKDLQNQQVDLHGRNKGNFVPSKYPSAYFDRDTIQHLLDRHHDQWISATQKVSHGVFSDIRRTIGSCKETPSSLDDVEKKDDFAKYLRLYGVRLLATAISAGLNLDFMIRLWIAGFQDVDMPLPEPTGIDRYDFQRYQGFEAKFNAHSFPSSHERTERYKTEKIRGSCIIPILYKREIGSGANAKVYEVRLHEDHHDFTPDRNEKMALKVLKRDDPQDTNAKAESSVLQTMADAPHEHLTPFYASWSHKNRFQMLFPLAEMDLEKYLMEKKPPPVLDDNATLWLVNQMGGLASALDQIHNLQPPGQNIEHITGIEMNRKHLPRTGVHLDLSLKNILMFAGDIMKIGDFGSAQIQQICSTGKSNPTCKFIGNPTYAAPDEILYRKVSRPYDIFSLGCIFLEILLWVSSQSKGPKEFSKQREMTSESQIRDSDSKFFEILEIQNQPTARLKKCVDDKFSLLTAWISDELEAKAHTHALVYKTLLDLIKRMMEIPKDARPLAAQVRSWFDHLKMQVKAAIDFPSSENNPKCALPTEYPNSVEARAESSKARLEELLSPAQPTFRTRSNSAVSLYRCLPTASDQLQEQSQTTDFDMNAAISETSGGQADASPASIQLPSISITHHEPDTHLSELSNEEISVYQRRLQAQPRPLARIRSESDPRRVQTA